MSLTNPKNVVTEERLSEFYNRILPYLGGTAEAGFTPVGTVISVMGKTAPANYLACDGSVYNIADYPELANYFLQQFESKNYFGGDGTTTFAVPNLSGEFLRGTGSNGHSGQGGGSSVGTHQDGTESPQITTNNSERQVIVPIHTTGSSDTKAKVVNPDYASDTADMYGLVNFVSTTSGTMITRFTSRPTNTSVLFCIATKNIYLNPSLDYSTDEKVVGTWIDGKTLYQKTLTGTISVDTDKTSKNTTIGNVSTSIENVVSIDAIRKNADGGVFVSLNASTAYANEASYVCNAFVNNSTGNLVVEDNRLADNGRIILATVRYTKTSD